MATEKEYRVFGPPGTGKTTFLTKQIRSVAGKGRGKDLLISSFTKTAAKNLADQDLPVKDNQIGTLHSHCFQGLNRPTIAETKVQEFNEKYPNYALGDINPDIDEAQVDQKHSSQNDELFSEYQIYRNRLRPRESWNRSVLSLAKRWEAWKEENGYFDFTDLIEVAADKLIYPPGNASIGIFDEVQDFTPLQLSLIRKWADQMKYIMIAGDDDQCQPWWTEVETTKGYKQIHQLDPGKDGLLSYSKRDAQVFGARNGGYSFDITNRLYTGYLYTVDVDGASTSCTDNHIWLAKWTDEAKKSNKCCVYLMKKDNRFRVGWCQLFGSIFKSDGHSHLNDMANLEMAEKVWILKVLEDKETASWYGSWVSIFFGLPLIQFNASSNGISQRGIEYVFGNLDPVSQRRNASKCLKHHDCNPSYPIIDRMIGICPYGSDIFKVRACNLISGLMAVPIHCSSKSNPWEKISVRKQPVIDLEVYSLNVHKYHTYIADGIITHNCIFSFSGSTPEAFIRPEVPQEQKRVLDQSYRVPSKIQALAESLIHRVSVREPKKYRPREAEGSIQRIIGNYDNPNKIIQTIEDELSDGREVMVLGACGYMLNKIIKTLRDAAIPFHNPYRRNRGDWNPLGGSGRKKTSTTERVLNFFRPEGIVYNGDRVWSTKQLASWIELVKAPEVLNKGGKKKIQEAAARVESEGGISYDEILMLYYKNFRQEELKQAVNLDPNWLMSHAVASKAGPMEFPIKIYQRDPEVLSKRPQVMVGTIHSFKGGQADSVVLLPDLSQQAVQQYISGAGEGFDAVIRQFYVAVTRAREKLFITMPAKPKLAVRELV